MILFLTVVSGLAWTVVYAEAIRLGFRDRTYAIPAAALALNFAWEVVHASHSVATGITAQGVFNIVWGLADVLIVYTFLRFGRAELPSWVTRRLFIGWAVLLGVVSFAVQLLFVVEFGWGDAARYAAFLQNLLMSGLFIAMFVARGGSRGQSLVIAVAKWIGTLAPHGGVRLVREFTPGPWGRRALQCVGCGLHRPDVAGPGCLGRYRPCPFLTCARRRWSDPSPRR